ncbi:MAG: pyruvate formate-lyase-activating protein [Muribaculaceae bacterium]|nr:pyruvate formate-lyase-activating protein [Muribaculaceae bacterium]
MINVHSYESMGTFDGPGLRLVVFLQGCPFRCLYCANPDTISLQGGVPTVTDEILSMAIDQKPFFGRRGGITFSGGEPTLQAAELLPLFRRLKEAGIHICLDSNGAIRTPAVDELLGLTDLVLLDVKQFNPAAHKALTGVSNANTLATARWLRDHGRPMWLRYVLVPGISDNPADIEALCREFGTYENIERVEILPYHTLGVHKYAAMGLDYKLKDIPKNTPEQLDMARALFSRYFSDVIVN